MLSRFFSKVHKISFAELKVDIHLGSRPSNHSCEDRLLGEALQVPEHEAAAACSGTTWHCCAKVVN